MAFIRDFLINKAFTKASVDVDKLMQDNELEDTYMVQSLIFDKVVFDTEESVLIWAKEHWFDVELLEDKDQNFTVTSLGVNDFVSNTLKTIEISNGVIAIAGLLKIFAIDLNDRTFLSLGNEDKTIKFNDSLPHIIEVAKVVKGYHASYGEVELTKGDLQSFVSNFKDNVTGVDLMIDYDHGQAKAAGWIKDVFLSMDESTMYAEVKWTPKGAQALSDRDFRYFSPEFTLGYTHPHTLKEHGPTLLGGGLVNRPFLKMDAIVSFNDKNNKPKGKTMETISLSDHNSKVLGLEKAISDLKLSEATNKTVLDAQKNEVVSLNEKISSMEKENADRDAKVANEKLFSENKINKAQLDALNEGKTLLEVLALSEVMNTNAKGKTSNGNSDFQFSENDKAAMNASGLSEEDYKKYVLEA